MALCQNRLVNRTAILLFFLVLIAQACRPAAAPVSVSNQPTSVVPAALPSKPVAEMSWTDSNEKVQKVADFRGKAMILDFWATYCGPCREEIPHLNSLLAKYGAENLQIVGLNVGGAEDKPQIPKFLAETKIDYLIAFPEPDLTQYIFAERSDIPQTLVIDRNGRIVTKIIGFNAQIQRQLDEAVERAVKN
jgi:thiol-disulfide isomerase/thioredoxin